MTRPAGVEVIDLMMELPTGDAGMGMAEAKRSLRDSGSGDFTHHPAQYLFKDAPERMGSTIDPEEVVAMMDAFGVRTAQIAVHPKHPEIAFDLFDRFPGRFIGDIPVDPNRGMKALRQLDELARAHPAVKSASFAPCLCFPQVDIDAREVYPIYAKCAELGLPINVLAGMPGPRVPFECQDPAKFDRVAWFFPETTFVMRHGGEPWTELCVKLLLKWPNLFYSTSAFAPKHYPKAIIDFANTRGRDKVMFAGYYPGLSYERIFRDMDNVAFRDETWEPFLSGNAKRVFQLGTC
jgi:uncharacterized protein